MEPDLSRVQLVEARMIGHYLKQIVEVRKYDMEIQLRGSGSGPEMQIIIFGPGLHSAEGTQLVGVLQELYEEVKDE